MLPEHGQHCSHGSVTPCHQWWNMVIGVVLHICLFFNWCSMYRKARWIKVIGLEFQFFEAFPWHLQYNANAKWPLPFLLQIFALIEHISTGRLSIQSIHSLQLNILLSPSRPPLHHWRPVVTLPTPRMKCLAREVHLTTLTHGSVN